MKRVPFRPLLPGAALLLLLCSCGDLLVGEKHCHGEGVDCSSEAPTLTFPYGEAIRGSRFDVVPSRSVAPTWIYDYPLEDQFAALPQLAPAPGGGVWTLFASGPVDFSRSSNPLELQRINTDGEPVESHTLDKLGGLSADDELAPVVLSWQADRVTRATLGPFGEVAEWTIGPVSASGSHGLTIRGPEGRIRQAIFEKRGSFIAEYSPLGELLWKQSDVRDARDFPFEGRDSEGRVPVAAYRAVTLSDGAIALGVPKNFRNDVPGLSLPEHGEGITRIDPDGNLRWDIFLGETTSSMRLAPGLDGSVAYASSHHYDAETRVSGGATGTMFVMLIDRDGTVVGYWQGLQASYHNVAPAALCTDAAGAIYVALVTGERKAPVPTVCRMSATERPGPVVCLGVEDVLLPWNEQISPPEIRAIAAPVPGAVVLAIEHTDTDPETEPSISRLVRVDFDPKDAALEKGRAADTHGRRP